MEQSERKSSWSNSICAEGFVALFLPPFESIETRADSLTMRSRLIVTPDTPESHTPGLVLLPQFTTVVQLVVEAAGLVFALKPTK